MKKDTLKEASIVSDTINTKKQELANLNGVQEEGIDKMVAVKVNNDWNFMLPLKDLEKYIEARKTQLNKEIVALEKEFEKL